MLVCIVDEEENYPQAAFNPEAEKQGISSKQRIINGAGSFLRKGNFRSDRVNKTNPRTWPNVKRENSQERNSGYYVPIVCSYV